MTQDARKSSTGQEQRRAIAASNRSGLIWPFSGSNQTRPPGLLPGKSPRPRRHPCRSHPGAIDELANVTPDYENCLATVKLHLSGGETILTVSEGDGPVNALDCALRKALIPRYPQIAKVQLTDYKVRIIDGHSGTAARTRVLIDSTDGTREWSTVGVSGNIIDASWRALVDSIGYYLMKAFTGHPP